MTGVGLGLGLAAGLGFGAAIVSIFSVAIVLAACVLLFDSKKTTIGGGDVKLLMAVAALLGPLGVITIAMLSFLMIGCFPPKVQRKVAPFFLAAGTACVLVMILRIILQC